MRHCPENKEIISRNADLASPNCKSPIPILLWSDRKRCAGTHHTFDCMPVVLWHILLLTSGAVEWLCSGCMAAGHTSWAREASTCPRHRAEGARLTGQF